MSFYGNNSLLSSKKESLNWRFVGPDYWPLYESSIQQTVNSSVVPNVVSTPNGTFPTSPTLSTMFFSGGVLLADGRVLCIPSVATTTARIYDPNTDTLITPAPAFHGGASSIPFNGGVLLRDGRVFCIPTNNPTAVIYDPHNNSVTAGISITGMQGGVLLHDGRVFCVPAGSQTVAKIYDPATNTVTNAAGTFPIPNRFKGAVLLPDGRVFCVPYGLGTNASQNTARIYNPFDNTLTSTNSTTANFSNTLTGSFIYDGGVLLADGRVFCVPHNGTQAKIYDPVADVVTTPEGTYPGTANFRGGVLLPDGTVFMAPRNNTMNAYIYNPKTDSLQTTSLNLTKSTFNFSGAVVLPNGGAYCVPYNLSSARIYGGGGGFNINVSLSTYYNKL